MYTARYAGDHCSSEDNIDKLLRELDGMPESERNARFSTVIALATPEGEETFRGEVHGRIATERKGGKGFGYDPVFIADETGLTFAQMSGDAKDAISHRGRAMRAFAESMTKRKL